LSTARSVPHSRREGAGYTYDRTREWQGGALREIVKGYEFEKGKFVVLTEDELKELEPVARVKSSCRICFAGDIGPQWYDRPYWLGPDGDSTSYFALAEALANRKKEGSPTG
jgi:non-homologous end joining protein Ku